jgi:hypothetical protein
MVLRTLNLWNNVTCTATMLIIINVHITFHVTYILGVPSCQITYVWFQYFMSYYNKCDHHRGIWKDVLLICHVLEYEYHYFH